MLCVLGAGDVQPPLLAVGGGQFQDRVPAGVPADLPSLTGQSGAAEPDVDLRGGLDVTPLIRGGGACGRFVLFLDRKSVV